MHARGGTLDLLMTDIPDLVRVSLVAPIGNSDHSSLSAVISMAQAVSMAQACVLVAQAQACVLFRWLRLVC